MSPWKNYHLAHNLSDALQALAAAPGNARLIGGGTDLLLDLQQGRHPPIDTLVDVSQVPEMLRLEIAASQSLAGLSTAHLVIGASLPLNRVVASPRVYEHARTLYESASLIGGPQVRNTATLGGNVAHALPAADGTISLLALDAQVEIASLDGVRLAPVGELFLGPGRSAIDSCCEALVAFHLPLRQPGQASAFRRIMRPQGVAIAILNMSIWLDRQPDPRTGQAMIQDIRIAVGPAGPTPRRLLATEAALRGASPDDNAAWPTTLGQAAAALLAETHFRDSPHRATAVYRRRMAIVLLNDLLGIAWQRAATS